LRVSSAWKGVPNSLEEYANYFATSENQTTIFLSFPNHIPGTITSTHPGSQRGEVFDIK
jgi:ABC-type molybdate transport system permease subunit